MRKIIAYNNGKIGYLQGNRVIKTFDDEYTKADVLNEALNHARIEETGLKVPAILAVDQVDGRWAIIKEYIKGDTLETCMRMHPKLEEEYLTLFVQQQVLIHTKTAPLLNRHADRLSSKIAASELAATVRYHLCERVQDLVREKAVCHGDYNPSNVILTPGGEVYIIDWSHATQGSPAADVAQSYLLFLLSEGEAYAQKYLQMAQDIEHIEKDKVFAWLPILAAAQSLYMQGENKIKLLTIAEE